MRGVFRGWFGRQSGDGLLMDGTRIRERVRVGSVTDSVSCDLGVLRLGLRLVRMGP